MIQAALSRYFARHMGTRHAIIFPRARPPQRDLVTLGIVNRTFENRTQSKSIKLNPWIEFDWVRQSNEIEHHNFSEFDFRTNRIQSNKSNSIELNLSDCVRLSSETELHRTQLNGFRSIGSGEPIQSKPKASPSKQVFLALFYYLFNNTNAHL